MLVTGASGYIGGRLLEALQSRRRAVRCLARNPAYLRQRAGAAAQVVGGDLLDRESLGPALAGIGTAYYLVHSMGSPGTFRDQDRQAATNFARAAEEQGVRRIVYLGGLGSGGDLSPHLESRQEVGRILRASRVPTLEFRASIILGSGSLSFEMIRALVARLPVMVTPRWTRSMAQPIAVEDVVDYLIAGLTFPLQGSAVFEIGGADRVSYLDLLREYARLRGLKRLIVPVPLLTPRLSSLWLGLVTPLYARVGRKLIDSVRNETVVRDDRALQAFPLRPRSAGAALARALRNEDRAFARTRWSDALSAGAEPRRWGGVRFGKRIVDSRVIEIPAPAELVFAEVEAIGGDTGWHYGNWLWRLRGYLDLLAGGVGMRRGRRHPERLLPGDALDFWRVEAVDASRRLRLAAEMKVPGRAWLQFEVSPRGSGATLRQTAEFDPAGWLGQAYWYVLYPVHAAIFAGMLRNLANAVSRREREPGNGPPAPATGPAAGGP